MHRYTLLPYKGPATRYRCPQCNKARTFVPYIDTHTGHLLHSTAGRCNRLVNCGYHLTPKQYFENVGTTDDRFGTTDNRQRTTAPKNKTSPVFTVDRRKSSVDHICPSLLNQSIIGEPKNHFFHYLKKRFGYDTALTLARRYYLGNSKHWPGATVFWQVDEQEQIRTGKTMLYNPLTGKRVKQPFNHITWIHTALKLPQFALQQCLFGQHLLRGNTKPVALVESEKTAMIASAYMPEYTWLATGGLGNFTAEKCAILKGHKVIIYPDVNAFDNWRHKAEELRHITKFTVSDMLETACDKEDRVEGFDLADYLVGGV